VNLLLHDYGNYPFTRQLARELAARGHAVDYVYSETTQLIQRGGVIGESRNLKITGILLEQPFEKYNYMQRRACEIEHGHKLAAIIEKAHPNVVLSANTPLDAQSRALRTSRQAGAKFIFWLQDAIGLATKQTLARKIPVLGSLVGEYYIQLERDILRRSDQVVLISEDFLPLMKSWQVDESRSTVIPNWAPLEELPVQPKGNAWARAHGLADKFCFMYTGILGLKHNPDLFLQLAEAFIDNPDVRVVVVSAGDAADGLAREAAQRKLTNLVVLPPQPGDVYAQVLGAADVLTAVLSEDAGRYSAPSKVLSYLCAGRPLLLALPQGNLSARIVLACGAGLVCPPTDSEQWVEHARTLYENHHLAAQMGRNARACAKKQFDIAAITDRFEQVFAKACQKAV
jgi:colanic acid biosynthesis glycosyl transferase WcaI